MHSTPPPKPIGWLRVGASILLAISLVLICMPSARMDWLQLGHALLYVLTAGAVAVRDYRAGWLKLRPDEVLSRVRKAAIPPGSVLEVLSIVVGTAAIMGLGFP